VVAPGPDEIAALNDLAEGPAADRDLGPLAPPLFATGFLPRMVI
jgi:hypothetical protein